MKSQLNTLSLDTPSCPLTAFMLLLNKESEKKQHIQDFQDSVDLVHFSGKPLVMEHAGFLQIPRGAFQAKYASKKPKLEVIQVVQFERGSNEMHWKESNVDEF